MTPAAFDSHRLSYSNTHTSTFRFFKIPKSQNPNPKNIHPEPAFLGLSRCIIIIILFTHSKTRTTRAYRAPIGVAVRRRASDVARRHFSTPTRVSPVDVECARRCEHHAHAHSTSASTTARRRSIERDRVTPPNHISNRFASRTWRLIQSHEETRDRRYPRRRATTTSDDDDDDALRWE